MRVTESQLLNRPVGNGQGCRELKLTFLVISQMTLRPDPKPNASRVETIKLAAHDPDVPGSRVDLMGDVWN